MKNQAGIDLANLSDAQKKMLVRLLAINNVEISHDKDSYFATLKVPTNDVNNYLNQQKGQDKKNTIETAQLKKQQCALKQREQNKQKSMAKLPKKQATSTTPQKPKPKPQSKPVPASKKPLFKSIKLQPIPRLQTLSPTIQIYIYPKRLPLLTIQQQIQQTYDQYWQISKTNTQANFVGCFYQVVCPFLGPGNKAKNDQSLVNTLESFHHFQVKEIGVRMFVRFMAEEMTKDQLAYFMVIRALLQQLFGQRILTHKPKSTTTSTSSQSNLTPSFSTPKLRLKWNPFTRQIPEPIVYSFLKIASQGPIDKKFERLTQHMYYCEQKKGNFIMYYNLIQFMLNQFERQCVSKDKNCMESMDRKSQSVDVDKLNLSYSRNDDSTLKDILLQYSCRTNGSRLKTKFQMELISEQSVERVKEGCKNELENDNILVETAIERGKDMCRRVQISPERQQIILQKIIYCVDSIRTMDKIKWVQAMQIEGTEEQLYFIEQLQMHYRNACTGNARLTMVNNLVKRIFGGPGFIKLFSSSILF